MKCGNMQVGIHQHSVIQTQSAFLNLPERVRWQASVAGRQTGVIASWKRHRMLKCCFDYTSGGVRCCCGCCCCGWHHPAPMRSGGAGRYRPWSWEVCVLCGVTLGRCGVWWAVMLYLFCVYLYLLSLALTGQHSVGCWLHSINHCASPSCANMRFQESKRICILQCLWSL